MDGSLENLGPPDGVNKNIENWCFKISIGKMDTVKNRVGKMCCKK